MPGKACIKVTLIPVTYLAIESEMKWTCTSRKRLDILKHIIQNIQFISRG